MEYLFYSTIYSSYFLLLAASVFGILKYRAMYCYERCYICYLLYTFLIEASVTISVDFFHVKNTIVIYPFYIGGIFSILTFLYIRKLNFPKIWSFMVPALGVLYLAIHRFFDDINHDHIKVISNVIIFGLVGFTLLQEIRKTKSDNRFLWVDALMFLYYSVSAFIFILHNQLGNMSKNHVYLVWGINNVLTCVLYSSFIYTFLKLKK